MDPEFGREYRAYPGPQVEPTHAQFFTKRFIQWFCCLNLCIVSFIMIMVLFSLEGVVARAVQGGTE